MISTNDTSILAMFSRYPDISNLEAEEHMSHLEHERNRGVCEALLGLKPVSELDEDQQLVYQEVLSWSTTRTRQIRNEQIFLRRRGKTNNFRNKMLRLYEKGLITDQTMMLYAISGPLPDKMEYRQWTSEKREAFWTNRMEERLPEDAQSSRVNWQEFRGTLREWFCFPTQQKVNWVKEGF